MNKRNLKGNEEKINTIERLDVGSSSWRLKVILECNGVNPERSLRVKQSSPRSGCHEQLEVNLYILYSLSQSCQIHTRMPYTHALDFRVIFFDALKHDELLRKDSFFSIHQKRLFFLSFIAHFEYEEGTLKKTKMTLILIFTRLSHSFSFQFNHGVIVDFFFLISYRETFKKVTRNFNFLHKSHVLNLLLPQSCHNLEQLKIIIVAELIK